MKKTHLLIVLVIVLAMLLTGCGETYNYGPISVDTQNTAQGVVSNGGLVSQQGNYVYFVNGVGSISMDNKFGQVVRGAIMRATLDQDGNIVENSTVTVVPKVVYSGQADVGFAIFGNWLYYVSPSIKVDKQGNRMTNITDFYRVKLDGTGTQKICEVPSISVNYVFTKDAILYHTGSSIYSVDLSSDKFTTKTIATDVTGYMFPEVQDYYANDDTVSIDEYVFYTKADEDQYETANYLYAANPTGTKNELLIGPSTYTSDVNDYVNRAVITPIKIENGVLYYNKAYTAGGSTVAEGLNAGLYCYDLNEWTTGGIDKDNEQKLSLKAADALYAIPGVDNVVLAKASSKMYLYNFVDNDTLSMVESFASAISVIAIEDVEATATSLKFTAVFKRSGSEDLYSYVFAYNIENGVYTLNTAAIQQAVRLTETNATATYLVAERLNGWFYHENKYGYISRVKIGEADAEAELLGKMTSADWEAYLEDQEDDAE